MGAPYRGLAAIPPRWVGLATAIVMAIFGLIGCSDDRREPIRIGLLVCLVLHVIVVAQLAIQSKAARPAKYAHSEKVAASLPARWMMYSGLLILAFVVFHILHFTTGTLELGEFEHGAIYGNLSSSFSL